MRLKNPLLRLILILAVLVSAGLACNFPGSASGDLPPTARPMSTEEVQNLEQQVQQTLENPNENGEVTITLSQDQVNSLVVGEIAQQPDLGVSDPSVVLTGGNMEVYGKVTQNGVSANLKAVMQPQIDSNGDLKLNITSMNLGGLPVPDVLKDRVSTLAENAFNSYLEANTDNFKARSISMGEGQMTITGTR
jgi:hypothetical protein